MDKPSGKAERSTTLEMTDFRSRIKINRDLFGSLLAISYLCTVRMKVLAIRAESREGKTISTLPILKESLSVALLLSKVSLHEHFYIIFAFHKAS